MIPLTEDRKMLGYELLASYPGISCFVTTRHGGCSQGNYASLNCTPYTGDEAEAVRRNQEIVCSSLPQRPQELVIPFQTHGTKALVINGTYLHATAEERHSMLQGIDALITREPGCCICISTADCIPILLYDRKNAVIAAVHAGWRGTLSAFEVGDEVYEAFRKNGFQMDYISEWKPATHKYHIDLWAANRLQLLDFGVPSAQVETANICTFTQYEEFFSARRMGIKSGRILSGIMLTHSNGLH